VTGDSCNPHVPRAFNLWKLAPGVVWGLKFDLGIDCIPTATPHVATPPRHTASV